MNPRSVEVHPFSLFLPRYHTLRCLLLLRLECLLAVAPDHNDGKEAADNGGAEDDEDHRDADGPFAGEEEGVEEMVVVHKWLGRSVTEFD